MYNLSDHPSTLSLPPNNTIVLLLTLRNENDWHGGGVVPVVTGEDHKPEVKHIQAKLHYHSYL